MSKSANNIEKGKEGSATMARQREESSVGAEGAREVVEMGGEANNQVSNNNPRYGMDWFWVTYNTEGVGARTFQVNEDINNNVPDNNWN